ncbi:SDR family oxidoreductase [Alicycliphilus denitrificans]|uniref:SDR family oxidoreductase n=1 Tax=Alicycliphilus denitrificans TaxID=179636 RepID=A0A858ZN57_9BURK|nr:SDR family oxidoreductase [Alicycliphilus denitrificans]QKD42256.1 SDR family oxidoreductase [Alicycliphilus denitrificans]
MTDTSSFAGRHVFVAGGSSGINLGIAQAFARAGAHVTVMSRSPDKVQQAAEGLRALGAQALGISADVRDSAAVDAALRQSHERFGDIDVLVSGAAGNFIAPAKDLSPNGFRTVIDIDLNGSFHVLRLAYPLLRKPGASVINISAPQGVNPTMYQVHACAAKAGIDMMTRVLAMEWGEDGVRVNAIAPGPIADTEGMRRLAPSPEALANAVASVPLQRMGTLEDIAHMALFLSSPQAGYVTGAVIPVDGGSSLRGGRDMRASYTPRGAA